MLKKKCGANLNTLISEKICLVPGEISLPQMGLKDSIWIDKIKNQVEIIINLAATTNFDERYEKYISMLSLYKCLSLNRIKNIQHINDSVLIGTM